MSNNRNFHASKEEPRSGKFDGTAMGLKHMEKDLLPLYNKDRVLSRICVADVQ